MTTFQIIVAVIVGLFALVGGAFGFGHSRGKSKAEQAATERETKTAIESQQAASQRQDEARKGASDVQDTVTRMSDRDVDNELLRDWTRKDSGS